MRQSKDGRLTHIRDGREKWFYDKVKRMEKERKSCQKKSYGGIAVDQNFSV